MEERVHGWRLRVGGLFSKHRIRQGKRKQRNAVWGIAHGYGSASGEWVCSALLLVAGRGMEGVMECFPRFCFCCCCETEHSIHQ